MTTHLRKAETRFLPFNKGRDGGAGNPPSAAGIRDGLPVGGGLERDSVLDLAQNSSRSWKRRTTRGRRPASVAALPRYHQLDAVRRLVADCKANGPGGATSIQHTARQRQKQLHRLAGPPALVPARRPGQAGLRQRSSSSPTGRCWTASCRTNDRPFEQTLGRRGEHRRHEPAVEAGPRRRQDDHRHHPPEVPGHRQGRSATCRGSGSPSSSTRPTRRSRARAAKSLRRALSVTSRWRSERRGGRGRRPGGQRSSRRPAAGPAAERQHLRLHRHAEAQDDGTVRRKRDDGKFEPFHLVHDAAGHRGGLHPRRAAKLHDLQGVLAPVEEDRGRPALRAEEGRRLLRSYVELHPHTIVKKKAASCVEHFTAQSMSRDRRQGQGDDRHPVAAPRRAVQAGRWTLPPGERATPFKALVAFSGAVEDEGDRVHRAGMNSMPRRRREPPPTLLSGTSTAS